MAIIADPVMVAERGREFSAPSVVAACVGHSCMSAGSLVHRRQFPMVRLSYLMMVCLLVETPAVRAADSPEQVLEKHGLKRANGMWYASVDLRIPERLQAAERQERRVHELTKQVEKLLHDQELLKVQLAGSNSAVKLLREARNKVKGGSNEQKQLDEQIKRQNAAIDEMKKMIVPAETLGSTMPLKGVVMELVGARSELAYHALRIRRSIEQLPKLYEQLHSDRAVLSALQSLDPPGQLGAARPYTSELRTLDRMDKLLFGDELPVYREGKEWRVTGVANEELPIAFTFNPNRGPTTISRTMAEALGVDVAGRQEVDRRIDGGQNVKAIPARLESLRFGRHVLWNVNVLVLAPENENLGARISAVAFQGLRVRVVPEQLKMVLEPAASKE
jgi:hypothetical protein